MYCVSSSDGLFSPSLTCYLKAVTHQADGLPLASVRLSVSLCVDELMSMFLERPALYDICSSSWVPCLPRVALSKRIHLLGPLVFS